MTSCNALLLAAGFSRRFGSDKRLHPMPDGRPVAIVSIERWLVACKDPLIDRLFVVTRANDELSKLVGDLAQQHPNLTLLAARDAELGMGHSLASAVANIPVAPLIIGLADMPFVAATTITAIAKALNPERPNGSDQRNANQQLIVQPSHHTTPGNPLGFGAAHHAALCAAEGDTGARALVKEARRRGCLTDLPVADAGILRDIDSPADLRD